MKPCCRIASLASASILVVSLLLVLLTGGCSTPASPSSSGASPTAPGGAGTPTPAKPSGSITVNSMTFGGGANLDPQADTPQTFLGLGSAIFDTLVYLKDDGQFAPSLAERFEIAPDGMNHTFYIRKGVKFHDGSNLSGADVKFSIERMLVSLLATAAAPWRGAIASVDLKDDYTVVIRMKTPQFVLLPAVDSYMTAIVPKKYIEEKGVDSFGKNPIGSGPWKFVKLDLGNRLDLEANESYWNPAAVPKFKNLTVTNVPEESTRVAMLKTGELDIAMISSDSVAGLKAAGLRMFSWPDAATYLAYIFYDLQNPDKYAMGDVRVRKALELALDRQEMVDKLFGGYASRTILHPMSPKVYFLDTNPIKVDPYDPDQAKKLLTEAGYAGGFSTRIWDTTGQGVLATVNQAIAGYWRKVGVNADLVPIDKAAISAKFTPKHTPDVWNSMYTYKTSASLEFSRLAQSYHSTKGSAKNLRNPRLDELFDKVPTIADPAERKRLATEAAVLAHDEYSSLPLVDADPILALGSKVGGVTPYPLAADIMGRMLVTITHGK